MRTDLTGSGQPAAATRGAVTYRLLFLILLVAYCLYAGAFVYHTSFVVAGQRYFCLFDDAMISMRYASNLAHGYGLVWNPGGERVQGFTAPLWTLYMSLWHLLPIPDRLMSLPIQISGALCVLIALVYVRRLALALAGGPAHPPAELAGLSAVALTALYLPLNNWSLQGMEVSAIVLLVVAAACLIVRRVCPGSSEHGLAAEESATAGQQRLPLPTERHDRPFSAVPYLLLGVAALVRMDAAILLAAVAFCGAVTHRQDRWRHALWGGATAAVAVGTLLGFGFLYYGDPLPNTYYLKMTGYPTSLRMLRGWLCFVEFVRHAPWWMLALGLAPLMWRRDRGSLLLVSLFLTQCAYSIYVGGDAWEWWGGANRYITIAMPLFFVLLSAGVADATSRVAAELRQSHRVLPLAVRAGGAALVLMCIPASNRFGPTSIHEWLLAARGMNCSQNAVNVRLAEMIRATTTPEALIAAGWAGATPYFAHRRAHDLLGRCDRRIAREQARLPASRAAVMRLVPGHAKHDFDYSVLELQPDLLLHDVSHGQRLGELLVLYQPFAFDIRRIYVRRGSERVKWGLLRQGVPSPRTPPPPAAPREL